MEDDGAREVQSILDHHMNAFDEWLRTECGQQCADYPVTGGSEYLRNRLWWAFSAGQQASRDEIVLDLLKKAIETHKLSE
jgi:hypothetical protein